MPDLTTRQKIEEKIKYIASQRWFATYAAVTEDLYGCYSEESLEKLWKDIENL